MKKHFLTLLFPCFFLAAYGQGAGQAISLNGSQYISVDNSASLGITSSFTVECWVYLRTAGNYPVLVEKGTNVNQRFGLQVFATGELCGYISTSCNVLAPAGSIPPQEWVHLAYVFDDATNQNTLYRNGEVIAQSTELSAPGALLGNMNIGRSITLGTRHLDGIADEMRLWNRALTPAEIRREMCAKLAGTEPGLIAYYRMDEGAPASCLPAGDVCDTSGHGNHGVLY
ncbi:MAG: LamG domain-containing protein [Bacteroidetes bacterium]|nr:LamG domain-containing protein [Bacteroidota bacterium]